MGMSPGKWVAVAACTVLALALSACAAPPPKDFSGRWHPVNRFSATTTSIPLRQSYEYFASPLDGTLRGMLDRWAKDTGMLVEYEFPDDFTLYAPVAAIHTRSAETAVSQLNSIYRTRNVTIATRNGAFVVAAAASAQPVVDKNTMGASTPTHVAPTSPSSTAASRPATAGDR